MADTVKYGSKGDWVSVLQYILGADVDGKFGKNTQAALKKFQADNNLAADGIAGSNTWKMIQSKAPTLRVGSTGAYVKVLEYLIGNMSKDNSYTQSEMAIVKAYQVAKGLTPDGIVGKNTWAALFGASASAGQTTGGTNSTKPVDYKQYDSRWGSIVYTKGNTYNKKQTIKNSGCGVASAADVVATWWDKSITPKEMAKLSVDNGYRTTNSGTAWGYFKFVAQKYGASKFVQTSSIATAQTCLQDGGIVVVSVGKSIWTSGGHYICWWKYDGKYVYINDPASSASNRAKNTLPTLKSAAKQYFCFWK